jgi:hypothetical protein
MKRPPVNPAGRLVCAHPPELTAACVPVRLTGVATFALIADPHVTVPN